MGRSGVDNGPQAQALRAWRKMKVHRLRWTGRKDAEQLAHSPPAIRAHRYCPWHTPPPANCSPRRLLFQAAVKPNPPLHLCTKAPNPRPAAGPHLLLFKADVHSVSRSQDIPQYHPHAVRYHGGQDGQLSTALHWAAAVGLPGLPPSGGGQQHSGGTGCLRRLHDASVAAACPRLPPVGSVGLAIACTVAGPAAGAGTAATARQHQLCCRICRTCRCCVLSAAAAPREGRQGHQGH